VLNLFDADSGGRQAIPDGLRGKTRAVFATIETLFLDRRQEHTIPDDGRSSIPVIRIDAKNVHD
jgi:hypothetical protein